VKLSAPAVERGIRAQARRELRESPLLWKEYRQHRTRWWRRNRNFRAALGSVYILAVLFLVAVRSGRALALLCVVALYASGTALFRCAKYHARVLRGYHRAVLIALPVLDEEYLRHESRGFFRSWVGAFAVFVLAYGAYAIVYGNLWHDLAVILVASSLQTFSGVCIGTVVLAYRAKWIRTAAIVPFYGLMIVCLYLPEDTLRFLWSATLITPAGWVAHGFAAMVGSADSAERFWFFPAFILSAALPLVLRDLRSRLATELAFPDSAFDAVFVPASGDDQEQTLIAEPSGTGQPWPVDIPLVRELKGADWSRLGWIERIVAASLTDREKVVAEFMQASELGTWSKKWRIAAVVTAVGAAIALASPTLPSWLFFLPMVFAGFMSAPIVGGLWPGFNGLFVSGFVLPAYASFPIGYGEISRVMLKTNVIRALTWAPLAIIYAAALARRLGYSFEYGSAIGCDVVLILIALQPVVVAGHFSAGSNDTRQINRQTILFFSFALVLLIIVLVAIFMMFIVPTLLVQAIAIAVVFTMSLAGWAGYKLLLERGRIDLLSRPRTQ
jgi:hypothetical protein